jgi:hypothetical protein
MFKFTVYRKVSLSRNFFLLILIVCLVAVSGKMVLAHKKIATYEEAIRLFESGKLVAAEKEFRAAKLNVSISDHNKDINLKLSILSPIREEMEDLDETASDYHDDKDLENLTKTYDRWQENNEKWVTGTAVQKDMYGEMLALTKLDKDMENYFSEIKKTQFARLDNTSGNDSQEEEEIYDYLNLIPGHYYGSESKKTIVIQASFKKYYSDKMAKLLNTNSPVREIVTEGNRQFEMLFDFSIDINWLRDSLDQHLLKVLTAARDEKDYANFAEQANSTKRLSSEMAASKLLGFIEETKTDFITEAQTLIINHKYADAISIYEALTPLEATAELIKITNLAWDKYEPIRVLQRLHADKQFPNFVNATNKWGADSVVAAISNDNLIYFGKLTGEENMVVKEGSIENSLEINKITFHSNLSTSDNPVIFIDAKSESREHRYMAFEVRSESIVEILDVEADHLTVESNGVLLVDNPVGTGEGEQAYYESGYNGYYQFTKIKVDYIEISKEEVTQYIGKKVLFRAYNDSPRNDTALIKISEAYNYDTRTYDREYVLLKGQSKFSYGYYDFIGVVTGFETIDNYGTVITVPVVQVEKME